jgi:DNA polymerase type B, organellar and viral
LVYIEKNIKKKYKIPIIVGEMYSNMKKSYTRGAVDFYKPFGKNIKGYDVNSLYPSQMEKF